MRTKIIYTTLLLALLLSCRKEQTNQSSITLVGKVTLSLPDARRWFGEQQNPASTQATSSVPAVPAAPFEPDWDHMEEMRAASGNYWLYRLPGRPVFENTPQGYRKLAIYRDSTGYIQARILEIVPDGLTIQRQQEMHTSDFTGRIFFYDLQYHLLGGRILYQGKQIGAIRPSTGGSLHVNKLAPVTECFWTQSGYKDGAGNYTIYDEQICNTIYYDLGGGGSGGGFDTGSGDYAGSGSGGGSSGGGDNGNPTGDVPAVSNLPGEEKPAIQAKQYMQCFSNIADAGATLQVTVYVQEPWPETTFNMGPNSVGHTAIGLYKSNEGASVNQVVGFYPDAKGKGKFHAPSKLVDNGGDLDYNASITYTVTASQFAQIVNYVASPPATYDLENFNCTSFVYYACQAGGIGLPNPYNVIGMAGPGGAATAMAPAGLGASIENMKGQNNVNKNGGTAPNSKGACN